VAHPPLADRFHFRQLILKVVLGKRNGLSKPTAWFANFPHAHGYIMKRQGPAFWLWEEINPIPAFDLLLI
jgi:hypothetical protein